MLEFLIAFFSAISSSFQITMLKIVDGKFDCFIKFSNGIVVQFSESAHKTLANIFELFKILKEKNLTFSKNGLVI